MARSLYRVLVGFAFLPAILWLPPGSEQVSAQQPAAVADDLAEFRTVESAITAQISKAAPIATVHPGYLGLHVAPTDSGVTVAHVQVDSPAARAGLQQGDLLARA